MNLELSKQAYTENEVTVVGVPNSLQLDDELAEMVAERWQAVLEKAKQNNQEVWDDPMQRFEGAEEYDGALQLNMSQTRFSTRYSLRGMIAEGKTTVKTFGSYVHCLVRTSDDWYVFGKKSGKYVSDHNFSFIGGVLDYDGKRPRTPFEVARIELSEEAGIASEEITSLELVGMYESDHGSIGMTMSVVLRLDKTAVLATFTQKTDKELASLEFIRKEDVVPYMRHTLQRGEAEIETVRRYLERK